jgi:hypothetical protein
MWNAVSVAVAAVCIQWFLPFTRVTDSSKCATPASTIASVIAVFASATACLTRLQASVTQPEDTSIPATSARISLTRPTGT